MTPFSKRLRWVLFILMAIAMAKSAAPTQTRQIARLMARDLAGNRLSPDRLNSLGSSESIYLPLILSQAELGQSGPGASSTAATVAASSATPPTISHTPTMPPSPEPSARPSATSEPAPSATPEAGATSTATQASQPPSCDRPLADRLVSIQVPVVAQVAVQAAKGERYPIFTVPRNGGGALVGWSDVTEQVHLTQLDAAGRPEGSDRLLPGRSIHGLVAHEDGSAALLVARPDKMLLIKVDAAGELVFEKTMAGGLPRNVSGVRWIDELGYESRLAWTGEVYAVNLSSRLHAASRGSLHNHMLRLFASDGWTLNAGQEQHYPSWEAVCTQSLDLRMIYHAAVDQIAPVSLCDGLGSPGAGAFIHRGAFALRQSTQVGQPMASNRDGLVKGQLGGLAVWKEGVALTYATETGRRMSDIVLNLMSIDGNHQREQWLTNTPGQGETAPHLAPYGEDLLAGWKAWDGSLLALQLDDEGRPRGDGKPQTLRADVAARDDWVNLDDQSIAWTYVSHDRSQLTFVRIPYCR